MNKYFIYIAHFIFEPVQLWSRKKIIALYIFVLFVLLFSFCFLFLHQIKNIKNNLNIQNKKLLNQLISDQEKYNKFSLELKNIEANKKKLNGLIANFKDLSVKESFLNLISELRSIISVVDFKITWHESKEVNDLYVKHFCTLLMRLSYSDLIYLIDSFLNQSYQINILGLNVNSPNDKEDMLVVRIELLLIEINEKY